GSGYIRISVALNSALMLTIPVTDTNQVQFSGSKLVINPSIDLAPGIGYVVGWDPGAIKDFGGNNAYTSDFGLVGTEPYNFRTVGVGDTTPASVQSQSITDNATNVPVNTDIVITFTEPVSYAGILFHDLTEPSGFSDIN